MGENGVLPNFKVGGHLVGLTVNIEDYILCFSQALAYSVPDDRHFPFDFGENIVLKTIDNAAFDVADSLRRDFIRQHLGMQSQFLRGIKSIHHNVAERPIKYTCFSGDV